MFKRHELVQVNSVGRRIALIDALEKDGTLDREKAEELIMSDVPAIVKRQEAISKTYVEVGFSSHKIIDGNRYRIASQVPTNSIIKKLTPFQVMSLRHLSKDKALEDTLEEIFNIGLNNNIDVGIYGSTALQIITGLPYRRENSDIDIFIKKQNEKGDYTKFYREVLALDKKDTFDIEVEIRNSYGVKLKEIFSGQKTVLAKGFYNVEIMNISDLNEWSI